MEPNNPLSSNTDASAASQYLSEFEGAHRMARVLRDFIGAAIAKLPNKSYDLLVDEYHLANHGFPPRNESNPSFILGRYRKQALTRARKSFLRELEQLLSEAAEANFEDQSLQDIIAVVAGNKTVEEIGQKWPSPTNIEIIGARELQNSSIVLPTNRELIDYFVSHPEALHLIQPREFEILAARILNSFGYRVEMGSLGRDGGVDVYAERTTRIGRELVLVQCKHYRPDRKVGEPIIKQLYAEVVGRRATRGLVVTNSFFTRDALSYIEVNRYSLEGADNARITAWLSELSATGNKLGHPTSVE